MSNELPTLAKYWEMLNQHDWYYSYSDDGSVYRRGSEAEAKLLAIAKKSPEHQALFDGFRHHHFSGGPWNTEKAPKPEKPS